MRGCGIIVRAERPGRGESIMKFAAMLAAVLFLAVAVPAADAAVEGALDTPEEPDIIELLYADLVLLNQYLTVFSGATINVPEMDKTQKAMILYALWNKDYELAARRAWNYVQSKALWRARRQWRTMSPGIGKQGGGQRRPKGKRNCRQTDCASRRRLRNIWRSAAAWQMSG